MSGIMSAMLVFTSLLLLVSGHRVIGLRRGLESKGFRARVQDVTQEPYRHVIDLVSVSILLYLGSGSLVSRQCFDECYNRCASTLGISSAAARTMPENYCRWYAYPILNPRPLILNLHRSMSSFPLTLTLGTD